MTDILGMLWRIRIDWFSNGIQILLFIFVGVIIVLQLDENISVF